MSNFFGFAKFALISFTAFVVYSTVASVALPHLVQGITHGSPEQVLVKLRAADPLPAPENEVDACAGGRWVATTHPHSGVPAKTCIHGMRG